MNILLSVAVMIIVTWLFAFFFFRVTMGNPLKTLQDPKNDDLPPVPAGAHAGAPYRQTTNPPSLNTTADGVTTALADAAKIVEAQSRQAVVFRQQFPPRFTNDLSYFGGAPTAPASFNWPRWQDPAGHSRPLTFILQIDCREIPPAARLGVMPDDGVLYLFMELAEALLGAAYRVIHLAGPTDGWAEVPLPEDLPPAINRYHCNYAMTEAQLPRLLPRWCFTPTMVDIPAACYDERAVDAPYLWPDVPAEALRAAQREPVIYHPYSIEDFMPNAQLFQQSFSTFPHDWRAIQYLMYMFIEKLERWKRYPNTAPLDKQLSAEEKQAQLTVVQGKAQQFYAIATQHPADEAIPEAQRAAVWAFLADEERLSSFILAEAVTLSVEESLMRSPESAALIPPEVAERIRGRHALVTTYNGKEHVNTPERMLAPPSDVQGGQWEWASTHLLLFELSSAPALGRNFGEGVCQLYIAPADLHARRFDKVKLEFEAY